MHVSLLAQVLAKPEVTSLCKLDPLHNNWLSNWLNSYFIVSFRASHLHLIEFYGSDLQIHSAPQQGKYVS